MHVELHITVLRNCCDTRELSTDQEHEAVSVCDAMYIKTCVLFPVPPSALRTIMLCDSMCSSRLSFRLHTGSCFRSSSRLQQREEYGSPSQGFTSRSPRSSSALSPSSSRSPDNRDDMERLSRTESVGEGLGTVVEDMLNVVGPLTEP